MPQTRGHELKIFLCVVIAGTVGECERYKRVMTPVLGLSALMRKRQIRSENAEALCARLAPGL